MQGAMAVLDAEAVIADVLDAEVLAQITAGVALDADLVLDVKVVLDVIVVVLLLVLVAQVVEDILVLKIFKRRKGENICQF